MSPSGPPKCMNPFGLALYSPFLLIDLGASREPLCWWKWQGICVKCSLRVRIFCGNFSSSRRPWPACQSTWHGECYTSLGYRPTFPLVDIEDELENPWCKEEERQKRLSQGVDGAHMCTPFQCETCWMRNLERRDPIAGDDDVYVACIKQAKLDAMLGKSPLTILNHAQETRAVVKNASLINKTPSYHARGPPPLADTIGMGLAVDMELKSLIAKGCIREHVQFSTSLLLLGWRKGPPSQGAWVRSNPHHAYPNLEGHGVSDGLPVAT